MSRLQTQHRYSASNRTETIDPEYSAQATRLLLLPLAVDNLLDNIVHH